MNYLSVCAIVRNEGPYLAEFIEFHRLVGVEHFYIYNDLSADGTRSLLEDLYVPSGLVTCLEAPKGKMRQIRAYHDCLVRFGHQSEWIAFIDADEFLFSPTIKPLSALLPSYERAAGVAVSWCMFGAGGHEQPPDALVIDAYRRRAPAGYSPNRHVKSIVRPALIQPIQPADPHHFEPLPGWEIVDEHEQPTTGPFRDPTWERLRINHYWTRSVAEAHAKAARPDANHDVPKRVLESLLDPILNEVLDETIVPYVPLVERQIAALGRG